MWRPLVDVGGVACAYIACLEAPEDKAKSEMFNVSFHDIRISELALCARAARPTLKPTRPHPSTPMAFLNWPAGISSVIYWIVTLSCV